MKIRCKLFDDTGKKIDKIVGKVFKKLNFGIPNRKYYYVCDVFKTCIAIAKIEKYIKEYFVDEGDRFKLVDPVSGKLIIVIYSKSVDLFGDEYGIEVLPTNATGKCCRIIRTEEAKKLISYLYLLSEAPDSIMEPFSIKFGGFIEKESNLSHDGTCFVEDDAIVCGEAKVMDDAIVRDGALFCGSSEVGGNGIISGLVRKIYENSKFRFDITYDIFLEITGKITRKVFEKLGCGIKNRKYYFVSDVLRAFVESTEQSACCNYHIDIEYRNFTFVDQNSGKKVVIFNEKESLLVAGEYGVLDSADNLNKKYKRIIRTEEIEKLMKYLFLLSSGSHLILTIPLPVKFGGFIEKESNLSHDGTCFVEDDAIVCGEAEVIEDAIVRDGVLVCGRSEIGGQAIVSGKNTRIFDNIKIFGNARLNGVRLKDFCRIGGDTRIDATTLISKIGLNYEKTIPQIMRQATKTGNYNCTIIDKISSKFYRMQMVDGRIVGDLHTDFASKYELNDNHKRTILSKIFRSKLETVEERLNMALKEGYQTGIINDKKYQIFGFRYYHDYDLLNEFKKFLDYLHENPQFYQLTNEAFNVVIESYFDKKLKGVLERCNQRIQLVNDFFPKIRTELYGNIRKKADMDYNEFFLELESVGKRLNADELNDFINNYILKHKSDADVIYNLESERQLGCLTLGSIRRNTSIGRTFNQFSIDIDSFLNYLNGKTYGSINSVAEYVKFIDFLIEKKGIEIFYRELSEVDLVKFKDDYIAKLNNDDIIVQKNIQSVLREEYLNLNFIRSFENSIGKAYQIIFQKKDDYGRYDVLDEYTNFINIFEKAYGLNFTDEELQFFTNLYTKVVTGDALNEEEADLAERFFIKTSTITLEQKRNIFTDFKEKYFDEPMVLPLEEEVDTGAQTFVEVFIDKNKMFDPKNIYEEVMLFVNEFKEKYGVNLEISKETFSDFVDNYIKERFDTEYYEKLGINNIWTIDGFEEYLNFIEKNILNEYLSYYKLRGHELVEFIIKKNGGSNRNVPIISRVIRKIIDTVYMEFSYYDLAIGIIASDNTMFIKYLKEKYLNLKFLNETMLSSTKIASAIKKIEARVCTINDVTLEFERNAFEICDRYKSELAPNGKQITLPFIAKYIDEKISIMDIDGDRMNLKRLIQHMKDNYLNREFIENFRQFQSILRELSDRQMIVKPYETKINYFHLLDADHIEVYPPIGVSFNGKMSEYTIFKPNGYMKIMGPTVVERESIDKYFEDSLVVDHGTINGRCRHIASGNYGSIVTRELYRFAKHGTTNIKTDTREILEISLLKREIEIDIPNTLLMKRINKNYLSEKEISQREFYCENEKLGVEIKLLEKALIVKTILFRLKSETFKAKINVQKIKEAKIKLEKIMRRINLCKKYDKNIQGRFTEAVLKAYSENKFHQQKDLK